MQRKSYLERAMAAVPQPYHKYSRIEKNWHFISKPSRILTSESEAIICNYLILCFNRDEL